MEQFNKTITFKDEKQREKFNDYKKEVYELVAKYDIPLEIKTQQFLNDYEIFHQIKTADFKRTKAKESLQAYLEWRKKFNCFEVKESDVINELKQNKFFWHGKDKENVFTLVMKVKNVRKGTSVEEKMKFIAFHINQMFEKLLQNKAEQVIIIWDREGFEKKLNHDENFHSEFKKVVGNISNILSHHFKQVLVTHVNAFFQGLFMLAKPFLGEGSKKINLINEYSNLKKWYSDDQILVEQGGTSTFDYSYRVSKENSQQITSESLE